MIYLTGDTHRDFKRIQFFCSENKTSKEDIMVILGDAGINLCLDGRDQMLKEELRDNLPITLFCIHGNHEERPFNVSGYEELEWHGAKVYIDDKYPNQVFAKDGEIYDFNGQKVLVIGGAYSVDKFYRLENGLPWFESEQPSLEIKEHVIENLDKVGWKVDYVFSHTCPYNVMPRHLFLPGIDQRRVDNSTEEWLMREVASKLEFKKRWYFGHYHDYWGKNKYTMLYKDIIKFE